MKRFLLLLLPLFWGILNISAQGEVSPAQEEEEQPDTAKVHLKGKVVDENQDPVSLCMVRIEGQPIGQAQVVLHQDPPVCAIHVGSFNFGVISVPIRPIKIPGAKGNESGRETMKMYEKKFT